MTDYEMIYTFNDYLNLVFTVLMGYVSIVSAFLIVGYLISSKLDSKMTSIVVGLYTIITIPMVFICQRLTDTFVSIVKEIRKAVNDGASSLGWHNITTEPEFLAQTIIIIIPIVMILAYMASLIFYFHQRRVGLKVS